LLKEVLKKIYDSNYISKINIARSLDVPEELIEDAFSQLIRMGYIEEDNGIKDCSVGCGNCPYANHCNKVPVNTIIITKKGERLLSM
jgi:hypothetical protein